MNETTSCIWRRLVPLCVVAILAACSNPQNRPQPSHGAPTTSQTSSTVVTAAVDSGRDAAVTMPGIVTVRIPARAVTGTGKVTVSKRRQVPLPSSDLFSLGQQVQISLAGARLSGTATIEFQVAAPPGSAAGVTDAPTALALDETTHQWVVQPSTYNAATGTLSVLTTHFSLWAWTKANASVVEQKVREAIGGLSNTRAVAPTCANEQAARAGGWTVVSDPGARVLWCFGVEGGQRQLIVANNRPYSVILSWDAKTFSLQTGPDHDISVSSLYRTLLEAATGETSGPQIGLPPGASATLVASNSFPTDRHTLVVTRWDGLAMGAEALDTLVQTVSLMAGGADGAAQRFLDGVSKSDCVRKWILGDGGLQHANGFDQVSAATYGFLRECGPDLIALAADGTGSNNPMAPVAKWFTSTVVSALRQVIGDAYAGVDVAKSASGDAAYRMIIGREVPADKTSAPCADSAAMKAAWPIVLFEVTNLACTANRQWVVAATKYERGGKIPTEGVMIAHLEHGTWVTKAFGDHGGACLAVGPGNAPYAELSTLSPVGWCVDVWKMNGYLSADSPPQPPPNSSGRTINCHDPKSPIQCE